MTLQRMEKSSLVKAWGLSSYCNIVIPLLINNCYQPHRPGDERHHNIYTCSTLNFYLYVVFSSLLYITLLLSVRANITCPQHHFVCFPHILHLLSSIFTMSPSGTPPPPPKAASPPQNPSTSHESIVGESCCSLWEGLKAINQIAIANNRAPSISSASVMGPEMARSEWIMRRLNDLHEAIAKEIEWENKCAIVGMKLERDLAMVRAINAENEKKQKQ